MGRHSQKPTIRIQYDKKSIRNIYGVQWKHEKKKTNVCLEIPGKKFTKEKRFSQSAKDERALQAKRMVSPQTWRHERALPVDILRRD